MNTIKNDPFLCVAVVKAVDLVRHALMALSLAAKEVRFMLPEAAIPPQQRAEVDARMKMFFNESNERLNEFIDKALTYMDQRMAPQTINHIVEEYLKRGPLLEPEKTPEWLCQISNEFTEQWVMDLYKEVKPRLATN